MIKANRIIILAIIAISFLIGFYLYPTAPVKMASHWNIAGEVDGYMSKFWGLFLMPIISLAMFLLFLLIPRMDPMKENVQKFRKYFDRFILLTMLFLFYIYVLTISWSYGARFDMGRLMAPAIGILFFYAGVLIEKSKRNWFIGIRTPWTLSSESVWDKTHKLGGKLFKISGVIAMLGFIFPGFAFELMIFPAILFSIWTIVYSYFEFKKENFKK
jgi:uncharacterized membrane protein